MKTSKRLFLTIFIVISWILTSGLAHAQKKDSSPNLSRILISSPFFLRTCIEDSAKIYKRTKRATDIRVIVEGEEHETEPWQKPNIKLEVRFWKNGRKVWNNMEDVNATHGVRLGWVALAIYKNKKNPLKGLTIPQIDGIFSADRQCGFPFPIRNLGQLGLTDVWLERPVAPFGTAASPEVVSWFQAVCMCNGNFWKGVKLLATKVDLFQAISSQPGAIGFYLYGEQEKNAVPVAISLEEGKDYFYPTRKNIESGRYPLSGELVALFNRDEIGTAGLEFLRFCLSKRGQEILSSCRLLPAYPGGYKPKKGLPIEKLKKEPKH